MQRFTLSLVMFVAAIALSACASYSHTNHPLAPAAAASAASISAPTPTPTRATFAVSGERGNPRVLMFLALSGGGSRAAYFSAATMLRLQTLFADVDLLNEVDVMSSVSGGSITAALYAATRDTELLSPTLAAALPAQTAGTPLAGRIKVDAQSQALRCSAPLAADELAHLNTLLPLLGAELRRLDTLCRQAPLGHLREWDKTTALELTRRNYLTRWVGNWFWPSNIARYWFTAYDRSDIMAQTLADNLYGTRLLGANISLGGLNPTRPYLLINATTAADQDAPGIIAADEYAFGSVFTFTEQDFRDRINSDIGRYSLARAVMASSAFPLIFPSQTLQDHRPGALQTYCQDDREGELKCTHKQYLHVFDGGNSDNLGLKSIKRALFQMEVDGRLTHDRIVVLLVDAFTRPHGASRLSPDPRGTVGLLLDANLSDAVDSLLQNNRAKLLGEFDSARLRWTDGDCKPETRELPSTLCKALSERPDAALNLTERLVFYHFGFDDVVAADPKHAPLKRKLDTIPTSFKLATGDARLLDEAVDAVITPTNPCLQQIRALVLAETAAAPEAVPTARKVCQDVEGRRR
ncbi:MAG: patatin-like phospholipase family protein [Cytophagales bacterium]|nr:patatin-like phospholipase family protein [Rhizobacter sp.]